MVNEELNKYIKKYFFFQSFAYYKKTRSLVCEIMQSARVKERARKKEKERLAVVKMLLLYTEHGP